MLDSFNKPATPIDITAVAQCVASMSTQSTMVYFTKFYTLTDSRFVPQIDHEQAVAILEQNSLRLKAVDGEEVTIPLAGFKFKVDLKKQEIIFRTKQFVYVLTRTISIPELESLGSVTGDAVDRYISGKTDTLQTITDFFIKNGAKQKKHIWYGINWY